MIYPYLSQKPSIDPDAFIFKQTVISGNVTMDRDSSLWFGSVLRGDVNSIVIGKKTNIQDNTTIHVTTDKYPTTIGDSVTIGHNVVIHGSSIGNNSLIGMGAVILDGCNIASNVLIAAGSVLRMHSKIPSGVLVAGNPGKIKRELTEEEILFFQKSADNYLKYSRNYLTSSPLSLYSKEEIERMTKGMTTDI